MGLNAEHIGYITFPRRKHLITLADVADAHTSGDIISSELHMLDCATLAKGMGMQVYNIKVWEKSDPGTQIKAALRLRFFRAEYTQPAFGDPWKGSLVANRTDYIGFLDVSSGSYEEIGDGVSTDPKYAFADVLIAEASRKTFYSGSITNTLWMNVEIRETKTFVDPASIIIELDTLMV